MCKASGRWVWVTHRETGPLVIRSAIGGDIGENRSAFAAIEVKVVIISCDAGGFPGVWLPGVGLFGGLKKD